MLLYSPTLAAQEKKTTIEEEKVPFYQGTTIGVDIFGLGSKIFGGDITSTEISVEVNLKNRYVPVAEIGYGTTDTTDDGTNIHYKASAPYFRIGMNYNFFFKKKRTGFTPSAEIIKLLSDYRNALFDVVAALDFINHRDCVIGVADNAFAL